MFAVISHLLIISLKNLIVLRSYLTDKKNRIKVAFFNLNTTFLLFNFKGAHVAIVLLVGCRIHNHGCVLRQIEGSPVP